MLPDALAADLARAELTHPTLAATEQYLQVHTLMWADGAPAIAGVLHTGGRVDVYFRVREASYFLVVSLHPEGERWVVGSCHAEARSRVSLFIGSETMTAPEITAAVGLTPTRSWSRGDPRLPSAKQRDIGPYTSTEWFLCPDGDEPGEFEAKLRRLLDVTESAASGIRGLAGRCEVVVSVLYDGYAGQMWGLNVDSRDVARVAALGASIDVDLYADGPDLP